MEYSKTGLLEIKLENIFCLYLKKKSLFQIVGWVFVVGALPISAEWTLLTGI